MKSCSTAIFYLLKEDEVCKLHKLSSDEIWHFYLGSPVEIYLFHEDGKAEKKILGSDLEKGEMPQIVIPKNVWQGGRVKEGGDFALMGTTVSPAFDEADFELGIKEKLKSKYPEFAEIITLLT